MAFKFSCLDPQHLGNADNDIKCLLSKPEHA